MGNIGPEESTSKAYSYCFQVRISMEGPYSFFKTLPWDEL